MKKILLILTILSLISCNSREQKITKLLKKEFKLIEHSDGTLTPNESKIVSIEKIIEFTTRDNIEGANYAIKELDKEINETKYLSKKKENKLRDSISYLQKEILKDLEQPLDKVYSAYYEVKSETESQAYAVKFIEDEIIIRKLTWWNNELKQMYIDMNIEKQLNKNK